MHTKCDRFKISPFQFPFELNVNSEQENKDVGNNHRLTLLHTKTDKAFRGTPPPKKKKKLWIQRQHPFWFLPERGKVKLMGDRHVKEEIFKENVFSKRLILFPFRRQRTSCIPATWSTLLLSTHSILIPGFHLQAFSHYTTLERIAFTWDRSCVNTQISQT